MKEEKENLFHNALISIKKNKKNREEGRANCIPFTRFPRLSKKIPGIIQGTNWNISANSGVGKTQFTKSTFVLEPFQWVKKYPEKGIKLKIMYFALEESKNEFVFSMISNKLKQEFNIIVDPLELATMYDEETVSDDLIKKIESLADYFKDFFETVEIIDSISNAYGIYKYIRNYSRKNGIHYYYNFKIDKDKKNSITEAEWSKLEKLEKLNKDGTKNKNYEKYHVRHWAYCKYVPNNPNEYVICIVDHVSLLHPENGMTLHQAMNEMSAKYGRMQITKHFNYIFVEVQQQAAATEQNVYTHAGEKIIEKLKPTLAGLADNKLTARNAHVAIGLFAPVRYDIKEYKGYDISKLDDQYRSLCVLKNRIGRGNIEVPMFYNGAVTYFGELPEKLDSTHYAAIAKIQDKMR